MLSALKHSAAKLVPSLYAYELLRRSLTAIFLFCDRYCRQLPPELVDDGQLPQPVFRFCRSDKPCPNGALQLRQRIRWALNAGRVDQPRAVLDIEEVSRQRSLPKKKTPALEAQRRVFPSSMPCPYRDEALVNTAKGGLFLLSRSERCRFCPTSNVESLRKA